MVTCSNRYIVNLKPSIKPKKVEVFKAICNKQNKKTQIQPLSSYNSIKN